MFAANTYISYDNIKNLLTNGKRDSSKIIKLLTGKKNNSKTYKTCKHEKVYGRYVSWIFSKPKKNGVSN